ncbi:hypothetical protein CHS0354_026345 [Potamilus streckersoni]|uniref:Uncharacterized protein n=1 Tax=Potamilus streckersoni TaxID=2493646 RepID=A0AAE0T2U7_9BIVA|nr:hypothetical protein CHS0354_026345 [Potamilus streckersoni]
MDCVIQDILGYEFEAQCRSAPEMAEKSKLTDAIFEEEAQELAITVQEFRDYIEIDKDVVSDGVITDEDIVSRMQSAQASTSACGNDKEDDKEDEEDRTKIWNQFLSAGEVVEMLEKIRRLSQRMENLMANMKTSIVDLSDQNPLSTLGHNKPDAPSDRFLNPDDNIICDIRH